MPLRYFDLGCSDGYDSVFDCSMAGIRGERRAEGETHSYYSVEGHKNARRIFIRTLFRTESGNGPEWFEDRTEIAVRED